MQKWIKPNGSEIMINEDMASVALSLGWKLDQPKPKKASKQAEPEAETESDKE